MNAILTQSGLNKALLGKEKKPQDMKEETVGCLKITKRQGTKKQSSKLQTQG